MANLTQCFKKKVLWGVFHYELKLRILQKIKGSLDFNGVTGVDDSGEVNTTEHHQI